MNTVMFLSFRTDRSGQTVQTQMRLLLIRVYTVCNSLCIFWMHYSKEKPSCSTFRTITANCWVSEILGSLWYMYFLFKVWPVSCKSIQTVWNSKGNRTIRKMIKNSPITMADSLSINVEVQPVSSVHDFSALIHCLIMDTNVPASFLIINIDNISTSQLLSPRHILHVIPSDGIINIFMIVTK